MVLKRSIMSNRNIRAEIHLGVCLILALALLLGYINYVLPQYDDRYAASLLDKVERLESINGPKIVLIGNSNLAYGINSKLLEDALGMPVVNMGLSGSLGSAFHENMAKYNVCPGDVYVICHSGFDDNDRIQNPVEAWTCIENHFHLWKLLRWSDMPDMLQALPTYLERAFNQYSYADNRELMDGEKRTAFNEYGDFAIYREYNGYTTEGEVKPSEVGDECVNRINELNQYLSSRGANLVIAGYPIVSCATTASDEEFVSFQNELEKRLDCPVISNYLDYKFDEMYFYDFVLHLTSEGAELRTQQLIVDLQKYLCEK